MFKPLILKQKNIFFLKIKIISYITWQVDNGKIYEADSCKFMNKMS